MKTLDELKKEGWEFIANFSTCWIRVREKKGYSGVQELRN